MSDQNPSDIEVVLLQKELQELQHDVKKLSADVSGLVDAWKTANGVVAFIKWISGLMTAFGIIWAVLKIKIIT